MIEQQTPMMKQYLEMKKQYQDCILFYRIGDFYEMFYEDAIIASKALEITLTGKNCGKEERAPMCGVPYHAAESYLSKLIQKGFKVAICEQVEDPKTTKGIVKREVIRIVTPGTNCSSQLLDERKNNYLMCIYWDQKKGYGIASADVTTGDYYVTEVQTKEEVLDEIQKFAPSELVCNKAYDCAENGTEQLKNRFSIVISSLESWYFQEDLCIRNLKEQFGVASLSGLGLDPYDCGCIAAGAILQYLYETQKNTLTQFTTIVPYRQDSYMLLDRASSRNLELVETLREKRKKGSLLWVLDQTKTAMGARRLRSQIEQPCMQIKEIEQRLDAVEELKEDLILREELREQLAAIYDLERLIGKVSYQTITPRDMVALKVSFSVLPVIKQLLQQTKSSALQALEKRVDPLLQLHTLLEQAIEEEPPLTIKEGGIIRTGYHKEVDQLRSAKTEGKSWIASLEMQEREKTGIKNLKIKYHKVFGYHLEVTNSYRDLVPDTWIRKQTLASAERYITPELKELEERILGAEERLYALEYKLFCEIRDELATQIERIQKVAKVIAQLDVFASLAFVAEREQYHRPKINTKGCISIREGRHPVVEKMTSSSFFVPNDCFLDSASRVAIITGPNMAGKSTYMRQIALIVLMAQIGSFVPAKEADIGIVDKIFTRVGASDDLASGQSTFMVEMTEVANILRNATKHSLLILDEIGRGTSTFDGLAIARAVVEHICDPKQLGAKTLFATHYHELAELEEKLDGVKNYCISVKEQGEQIVFLRKIIRGGADQSYGIHVARLAGVPECVLKRAKEYVKLLEQKEKPEQLSFAFLPQKETKEAEQEAKICEKVKQIMGEIEQMSLEHMTPMQAFQKLYEIQKEVRECNGAYFEVRSENRQSDCSGGSN